MSPRAKRRFAWAALAYAVAYLGGACLFGSLLPRGGRAYFGDWGLRPETKMTFFALATWLFIVAVPMTFALRRRLYYPVGHCRSCSYNLTGNVSGVCPECGTKV